MVLKKLSMELAGKNQKKVCGVDDPLNPFNSGIALKKLRFSRVCSVFGRQN